MSASIYWSPVLEADRCLYTPAPQQFMQALEAGGIEIPGTVTALSHLQLLRALARYCGEEPAKNPFTQLAEAVEK
jgi:hypothetical protein